jgi:predicted enzyme related to lactoylglutathione lyase
MGKVTGIGGIFFRAKDTAGLGAWYKKHFGINSVGGTEVWQQEAGPTVFTPFKADTTYFGQNQQFMINLRVEGLDELIEVLKADGVTVEKHEDESYGKFAWVYDPEGNKIELWEPLQENE